MNVRDAVPFGVLFSLAASVAACGRTDLEDDGAFGPEAPLGFLDAGMTRDASAMHDATQGASTRDATPEDAGVIIVVRDAAANGPDARFAVTDAAPADASLRDATEGPDGQSCGGMIVDLESDPHNCGACANDCMGGACLYGF